MVKSPSPLVHIAIIIEYCSVDLQYNQTVRLYLILFYIERGLHSRTETGEREINGSTVHNMSVSRFQEKEKRGEMRTINDKIKW